jgi:hypothetical protein
MKVFFFPCLFLCLFRKKVRWSLSMGKTRNGRMDHLVPDLSNWLILFPCLHSSPLCTSPSSLLLMSASCLSVSLCNCRKTDENLLLSYLVY